MDPATENKEQLTDISARMNKQISEHRSWYIFQGTAFVIAGVLAIILPNVTAIGFSVLIGAVLFASGFIQAIAAFTAKSHWWAIISAVLSLSVGGWMIFNPVAGSVALATILAIFLLLEGIAELFLAYQLRPVINWGWLLISGIVSLLLGFIVFAGWPGASLVLLGIIIGINLLFYGTALLAITIAAKA